MAQRQHYLPQVYLRQWCDGPRLVLYRRVGPAAKLERRWSAPRSVAAEPDLYTLPQGGSANGLTGDGLESKLASEVDAKLSGIAERVAPLSGRVGEPLRDELIWLMQTFAARSPTSIRRVEHGAEQLLEEHREWLREMHDRALSADVRERLKQFLDARMPLVQARAALAAIVDDDTPGEVAQWLRGDVHVVASSDVLLALRSLGLRGFITFEDPVIEWDGDEGAPIATFALNPSVLLVVTSLGTPVADVENVVRHHCLAPLAWKRSVIVPHEVADGTHFRAAMASSLRPWDAPA